MACQSQATHLLISDASPRAQRVEYHEGIEERSVAIWEQSAIRKGRVACWLMTIEPDAAGAMDISPVRLAVQPILTG